MTSSRLRNQGFVNVHRKLLFRLMAILLTAYLFYAPVPWTPPEIAILSAQISGSLLIFVGILGRILATISIGGLKDRVIVRTELYSVSRNPLYFSSFLMAMGVGLLSGRVDFVFLAGISFLAIFYPMMLNEARYLSLRFEDFADYERTVPLFFPNFTLWKERRGFEINFKLVKRTLLDASLVLPVIPVMILIRKLW